MVCNFKTKFCAEVKYTLAELGHTKQYLGKDLDLYVKGFYEKALDCSDLVSEETLVNLCLQGKDNEYRAFLESFPFPTFSKLIEASRRMNEFVKKTSKLSQTVTTRKPCFEKKANNSSNWESQEAKPSSQKKLSYKSGRKQEFKAEEEINKKKTSQWIKKLVIHSFKRLYNITISVIYNLNSMILDGIEGEVLKRHFHVKL